MVDTVLVNGKVVVEHGSLTTISERETARSVRKAARSMLERASVRQPALREDL